MAMHSGACPSEIRAHPCCLQDLLSVVKPIEVSRDSQCLSEGGQYRSVEVSGGGRRWHLRTFLSRINKV